MGHAMRARARGFAHGEAPAANPAIVLAAADGVPFITSLIFACAVRPSQSIHGLHLVGAGGACHGAAVCARAYGLSRGERKEGVACFRWR